MSSNAPSSSLLVIGLGNPGADYDGTRHNIGAAVLNELAATTSPMPSTFSVHRKVNAQVVETRIAGRHVILAKPRSFMNLSGGPVKALSTYYRVAPLQILVVHDELDLDLGSVRIKKGGGLNGHNGLKDIRKSLETPDFLRLQVGIGRPPGRMSPASFVLKPFSTSEQVEVPIICADAADLVTRVAQGENIA